MGALEPVNDGSSVREALRNLNQRNGLTREREREKGRGGVLARNTKGKARSSYSPITIGAPVDTPFPSNNCGCLGGGGGYEEEAE